MSLTSVRGVSGVDEFPVGTRVFIAPHTHAFGDCFLVGEGTVVESLDYRSREKKELHIRFDSGVGGILPEKEHATVSVI